MESFDEPEQDLSLEELKAYPLARLKGEVYLKVVGVSYPGFDSQEEFYVLNGSMPGCFTLYDKSGVLVKEGILEADLIR